MENSNDLKIKFLKIADEVKNDLIQADTKAILIVGSLANSVVGNESDVDICVIKDGDFKHKPGPHFHRYGVAIAVDDIGLNYILENDLIKNYLLANKLLNSIIIYDRDKDFASYIKSKKEEYYTDKEVQARFKNHWEKGLKILKRTPENKQHLPATIFLSFFRGFCPAIIYQNKKSPTTRRMYSRFMDTIGDVSNIKHLDDLLGLDLERDAFDNNCEIVKQLSEKCTTILKNKNYEAYKENENYLNMDSANLFIAVGRELFDYFNMKNSANFCLKSYAAIIFELMSDYGYTHDEDFVPILNFIHIIFKDTTDSASDFMAEMDKLMLQTKKL